MKVQAYALPMIAVLVLVGAFGAFSLMGPMHAETGCPFMLGQTALCANTITHLNHWQVAFASIIVEVLLFVILVLFFTHRPGYPLAHNERCHVRVRVRVPVRPTLLQELFAQGILHPKVF